MPTYEYRCENGHEFEHFQKMSDEPLAECPVCGGVAERRISSGAGLLFKGSGFYITDYKNAGDPKRKSAEAASGDSGAAEAGKSGDSGTSKSGDSGTSKSGDSGSSGTTGRSGPEKGKRGKGKTGSGGGSGSSG